MILPHHAFMATNENRNDSLPLDQALDQIDAFIKKHLVCSMHHRAILALWVVHTYCYEYFPITPYLEISSPEAQSGKSLCLALLNELCHKPWLPGGVTAACLTTRLAGNQPTLLLDDWHTVLRSSGHQPLLALLKAGSRYGSYYPEYPKEKDWDGSVFCPKAFAGQGRLPAALAPLCIPIVLRRKKPRERAVPFWSKFVGEEIWNLPKSLATWVEQNSGLIRDLTADRLADATIASVSGPRHAALVPLMVLAGAAGSRWASKALLAYLRIFSAEQAHTSSVGLQLLSDIREFFTLQNDPPKIHTAPLLEYLNGLEERPWKQLTPNKLRVILQDYPIHRSSAQRIDGQKLKGFTFQHFVASWESYLPQLSSRRSPRPVPDANQVVPIETQVVPIGPGVVTKGVGVVANDAQVVANLP
jgi:hypothetical protein